ncbi:MAG: hypothetical protein AB7E47_06555 [Desulfovibrionaceae bacterium]
MAYFNLVLVEKPFKDPVQCRSTTLWDVVEHKNAVILSYIINMVKRAPGHQHHAIPPQHRNCATTTGHSKGTDL